MKRIKITVGLVLRLASAAALAGFAGLWIVGPPDLQTGAYAQSVTSHSAIIAKVGRTNRQLTVRLTVADPAGGGEADPVVVTEDRPLRVHALHVEGLRPGTRYDYVLESDRTRIDGGSFRTAPSDDATPVRFAAVGDSGAMPWWFNLSDEGWGRMRPVLARTSTPRQWEVARWIDAQQPDFFVHLGDIVYWPTDRRRAFEEAFFRPFGPLLRHAALFTLAGNHDIPKDDSETPFHDLFHNPSPVGIGKPQRNWTFAWGAVRIVGLDVLEPDFECGPRRAWLEQVLATATEPWIVVATHVPCFSAYVQRAETPALRDRLWPFLVGHGVDLVMSGDDHYLARFQPNGSDGGTQVVAGGGGKSLYDFRTGDARLVAHAKAEGFLLVEVTGLRLEGRLLGAGGEVVDRFVLDRSRGALPGSMPAARQARIHRLLACPRRPGEPGVQEPDPRRH